MRRIGWAVGAVLVVGICITALSTVLARGLVGRPAPGGSVGPVVLSTTPAGPVTSPEPSPSTTPDPETTGPTAVPRDIEHHQHRHGK